MTRKNNIAKKAVQQKTTGLRWIVIITILFCELLAYTWVRTETTQTILRVSGAQEAVSQKTSYHNALSVERDRLKSDDRITRIAKTRLNLSNETLKQTIYISGDQG